MEFIEHKTEQGSIVELLVVGDFSSYSSKSLKEFILESNKGRQVNFLPDIWAAL